MKIFLSALETNPPVIPKILQYRGLTWSLVSYYYVRKDLGVFKQILENSQEVLIDSGAYSFQVKGGKVDWEQYTREYAQFIRQWDCPKIIGYFEMDIDVLVGYEKVLQLRHMLESVTDKIIPVWHKNRGIDEFKAMCDQYKGKIVSISGLENRDIDPKDYGKFYNYAHNHGCMMHCLGMTKKSILDTVPFNYVDSASWKIQSVFGKVGKKKVNSQYRRTNYEEVMVANYLKWLKVQEQYYRRYMRIHKYP